MARGDSPGGPAATGGWSPLTYVLDELLTLISWEAPHREGHEQMLAGPVSSSLQVLHNAGPDWLSGTQTSFQVQLVREMQPESTPGAHTSPIRLAKRWRHHRQQRSRGKICEGQHYRHLWKRKRQTCFNLTIHPSAFILRHPNTCTCMYQDNCGRLTAALHVTADAWTQPTCPSPEDPFSHSPSTPRKTIQQCKRWRQLCVLRWDDLEDKLLREKQCIKCVKYGINCVY